MKEQIKKANKLKIFSDQPTITEADFKRLTKIGLIVPAKFRKNVSYRVNTGKKSECDVSHKCPNDVVSFVPLSNFIKKNGIQQDDAKRLILLETIRINGEPRQSHLQVLIVRALAEEKEIILNRIEKACNQKAK
ncbi:hypothetical protein OAB00_01325 [Akkermansiaceae bacterium]|nr:hypothetical protein [Akkermansiaceae bacterium]